MTLAFQTITSTAGNGTALVIDKPTGTVDGDLLIAHLASAGGTSYGSLAGWTEIQKDTVSTISTVTLYKIASGEGATFTFTMALNGRNSGAVYRINGHNPTTPINVKSINPSSGTAVSTGTVTPTVADTLLLLLNAGKDTGGTTSAYAIATDNPTWTERVDLGNTGISIAGATSTVRAATSATGSGTMTYSANDFWVAQLIVIAPAISGPANLKSLNTNLKANIKSINTNLIANVKSLDTNV